jgi:hypothetical protein
MHTTQRINISHVNALRIFTSPQLRELDRMVADFRVELLGTFDASDAPQRVPLRKIDCWYDEQLHC